MKKIQRPMKSTSEPIYQRALNALERFYGYKSFRPMQQEIIESVMSGNDTLVLMPTGGGKSVCFQVPALISEGCALVVSPLISLMRDQVIALKANGVAAECINSTQPEEQNRAIMDSAARGEVKLLYMSPERLVADMEVVRRALRVSLVAIDEAHCISQWGHDFRPVYIQLASLKEHLPGVPIMALTATADRITREDIASQLRLSRPKVFISSFDRPNISLTVVPSPSSREKMAIISRLIDRYSRDSGIIYCLSRKTTESMARRVAEKGYTVAVYHAGLSASQREESQRRFINGEVQVVCATIAFGMGIDKSNIRWVVHNNLPRNIECYYQEIGRAGRDGLAAEAVLFYTYADVITMRSFIAESGQPGLNTEKLERMKAFAEASVCRRRMLLSYFNEQLEHDCGNCDVCRNPPERIDGTTMARMAMSASARTGQKVGIAMLVDILRASARAEILEAGYDKIKTYGAGRSIPAGDWTYYIGQMVQLGLFEIAYNESNHLKITPYGSKVLYGQASVEMARRRMDDIRPSRARNTKSVIEHASPEQMLLNDLKDERARLARKEGVPPYMVFSDRTLVEIVTHKPVTLEQFYNIEGVSEHKLVKYWRPMVRTVCKAIGVKPPETRGGSETEVLMLHNRGFSTAHIAEIKNVKESTVLGHITALIDKDLITDFSRLINRAQYLRVMNVYQQSPDTYYDILATEYSAAFIRMTLAIARAMQRRAADGTFPSLRGGHL